MTIDINEIARFVNNPSRAIPTIINDLETSISDTPVMLNSKGHPFIYASSLIVGTGHAFFNRLSDAVSNMFPVHARNIAQLSRHMTDEERIGLFGMPSSTVLEYAISEAIFQAIAVDYTVVQGNTSFTYKRLVLPKDTEIMLGGYPFAIDNAVEIRYSAETGFQVVYDESSNNPMNPIAGNLLKKEIRPGQTVDYLIITLAVRQLSTAPSENKTSNEASGCQGEIVYQDYLYNIRAFLTSGGVKREILVAYNQDVFNPMTPTLSIELDTTNNYYKYEIPDVYISNGLGTGVVDIYTQTTKGELIGKDFMRLGVKDVVPNYQDYAQGAGKLDIYSAPLKSAGGMVWRAVAVTTGGSNAYPFEQIKQTFIQGRRNRLLPITENNLQGIVEERQYSSVKATDFVTKRNYSITKELPRQENKKFYSPMSCFVGSHTAAANDLVRSGVVLDNGTRLTIPHNVLFDITSPSTVLVNALDKQTWLSLSGEQKVDLINDRTLAYTPFYYVLDLTNSQAVLRTYHLDSPVLNYQHFQAENSALGLEVGIDSINVAHQDDGYLITMVTKSGQPYKELDNESLGVQMSFLPMDSNAPATLKGTFYGITEEGERIWQFKIATRFDVDINNILYVNGFNQFGQQLDKLGTELTFDLKFLFIMLGDPTQSDFDSDKLIDGSLYIDPMIAIIETDYNLTLGRSLTNLYSRIRPLVGEAQYKRYPADVPQVYTETKIKYEDGEMVIVDGAAVLEHRAGDIMYTSTGQVILAYRAGDIVLDENGVPVMLEPRDLQYHFDFIGFDGVYLFSGDDYDKEFAQDTKNIFLNVIHTDMDYFSEMVIDQTSLTYQPRNKLGYQKVVINSNAQSYLKQDLGFVVTYYLDKAGYKSAALKEALRKSTPRTINNWLVGSTTTANSDLIGDLRAAGTSQVKALRLDAFAGAQVIDVISNADALSGFSVRKLLQLSSDGLLSIKEDISVEFLPHDVSMVTLGPV